MLEKQKGLTLLPPLDYFEFSSVMERAYLVITDSGGVQEEAPSFGKPVLVIRNVTERNEGVRQGVAKLVGTEEKTIFRETVRLFRDPHAYQRMIRRENPYGDGHASARIARAIKIFLAQAAR